MRETDHVMATGEIKRMVQGRGFGFIAAHGGREIFPHRSGIAGLTFGSPHEGLWVAFGVGKGEKGPHVVRVHLAEASQLN
jgi:cold shock CspA family protein